MTQSGSVWHPFKVSDMMHYSVDWTFNCKPVTSQLWIELKDMHTLEEDRQEVVQ